MEFSGVSTLFVGLFFFFTLLYHYDLMETFLKNQIFKPATIKFSTPRSGLGNNPLTQTPFSCRLPQWHSRAEWEKLRNNPCIFPCGAKRWPETAVGFDRVSLELLTLHSPEPCSQQQPVWLQLPCPPQGLEWVWTEQGIDVWCWLTILRDRKPPWELEGEIEHSLWAKKMKYLFIVPEGCCPKGIFLLW